MIDHSKELLDEIASLDIKKLDYKELSSLSNKIRSYIIEECSVNGGHLASNLGVVELTVALHHSFNFPKDKLLFDVGHQCYTHKVLSGRSLENLRKQDGVYGFQKRNESEYDPFEAGHSSTSISSAMGMALARDKNHEDFNIVAFIGDSSLANGMAFEALNNNQVTKNKVIIVINDNDMSIAQPVGCIHNILQDIRLSNRYMNFKDKYRSKLEGNKIQRFFFHSLKKIKDTFKRIALRNNIFELMGYYYIGNVDGYDFKDMEHAFEKAKKLKSSVIIHVTTKKGKGYEPAQNENSSWHSVKPFDIATGKVLSTPPENLIPMGKVYAEALDEELAKNKDTILINPATTIGSGIEFLMKKYPMQALDVGISEEHAVTFAAGYGLEKKHAYVSIYSTFLQRSYDQVNHDIARQNLPVTLLIDRAGLVGSDGETHQGIFDESFLINMPNMSVAMGKDVNECKALFRFSSTYKYPLAIRYPMGLIEKQEEVVETIEYGKWLLEKESNSKKVAIISFGPNLKKFLDRNIDVTTVNAIFQAPLDVDMLKTLLDYENIIIYDPYAIEEGFTYHVLIKLLDLGYKGNIQRIALKNEYIQKGTVEEQEKRCHVDVDTLIDKIEQLTK